MNRATRLDQLTPEQANALAATYRVLFRALRLETPVTSQNCAVIFWPLVGNHMSAQDPIINDSALKCATSAQAIIQGSHAP